MSKPSIRPNLPVAVATILLVVAGCLIGATAGIGGDGFNPRVKTIDALAGLTVGALFVDRLLTFAPVFLVRPQPQQRAVDLDFLRLGYGALLGGIFVSITDLRAIGALTSDAGNAAVVSASTDRLFAVLAIAGGVIGLSRILSALNPKPKTAGTGAAAAEEAGEPASVPPPSSTARLIGLGTLGLTALLAWLFLVDRRTISLIAPDANADGTVTLVVRFGAVLVAAVVVEQLVERTVGRYYDVKQDKPIVTGAVALVLALLATWVLDLLLLHNIGFFGAGPDPNAALQRSTDAEIWFDVFATAAIIAGGTKPLHDLGARLRKTKDPVTGAVAGPPPPPPAGA